MVVYLSLQSRLAPCNPEAALSDNCATHYCWRPARYEVCDKQSTAFRLVHSVAPPLRLDRRQGVRTTASLFPRPRSDSLESLPADPSDRETLMNHRRDP